MPDAVPSDACKALVTNEVPDRHSDLNQNVTRITF